MADDVVEVALLGARSEIARVDVDAGAVAAQVGREAGGGEAAAQDHMAHVHAGALVQNESGVLDAGDSIARGEVHRDVDACAGTGEHTHGGAHEGGGIGVAVEGERDGEGGVGRRDDVDAGARSLALVRSDADRGLGFLTLLGGEHGGAARKEVEVGAHVGAHAGFKIVCDVASDFGEHGAVLIG